ncbi:unnamed protein product [Diamesa hyperborea]
MISDLEKSFNNIDLLIKRIISKNSDDLQGVKELFKDWIGSNRQMERIKTIDQLLDLLKRRAFYGIYEFNSLKLVRKLIHNEEFSELVDRHHALLRNNPTRDLVNKYAEKRKLSMTNDETTSADNQPTTSKTSQINKEPAISAHPIPPSFRIDIFQLIATGISSKEFRTLARYLLSLDSGELADIENKCHNHHTMNMMLLDLYEKRKNCLKKLLKCLQMMDRKDLKYQIEMLLKIPQ